MSLITLTLGVTAHAGLPTCTLRAPGAADAQFGISITHAGGLSAIGARVGDEFEHFVYAHAETCGPPDEIRQDQEFLMLHGEGATTNRVPGPTELTVLEWSGTTLQPAASLSDPEILATTGVFALRQRSGDRIVAGASEPPYPSFVDLGVYVAPDWEREALLRIEPFGGASSSMGFELSGWTLIQPVFGGVRIWERHPGGDWLEDPLGIDDADDGRYGFGRSVAIWRDTIAVGVPYGPGSEPERGLVLVYQRDPSGAWSQTAELLGAESGARFGYDVELWGNLLVVGAQGATDVYGIGHVEVFRRSPTGWDLVDLAYSPESATDAYGAEVELWGTVALVPQSSSLLDPAVFVYQIPAVDQDEDGFDETTDCADLDPDVFPGAPERCGDSLDDNCNESADEGCPDDPAPDTGDSETGTGTGDTGTGDTSGPRDPRDADAADAGGCGCGGQPGTGWTALLLLLIRRRR